MLWCWCITLATKKIGKVVFHPKSRDYIKPEVIRFITIPQRNNVFLSHSMMALSGDDPSPKCLWSVYRLRFSLLLLSFGVLPQLQPGFSWFRCRASCTSPTTRVENPEVFLCRCICSGSELFIPPVLRALSSPRYAHVTISKGRRRGETAVVVRLPPPGRSHSTAGWNKGATDVEPTGRGNEAINI